MSEWPGFDQRKVCPQCGEYQTSFRISERRRNTQDRISMQILLVVALFITLFLVVFTSAIATAKEISLKSPQFIVLLFSLFIIIGSGAGRVIVAYLNSRQNPGLADRPLQPGEHPTFYRLYCRTCGYTWEMTIDEWEEKAQTELKNPPSQGCPG